MTGKWIEVEVLSLCGLDFRHYGKNKYSASIERSGDARLWNLSLSRALEEEDCSAIFIMLFIYVYSFV